MTASDSGQAAAEVERQALRRRLLGVAVEAAVLERALSNVPTSLYLSELHEAVAAGGPYAHSEVVDELEAALVRYGLQDEVRVETMPEPDWHCTVHGEWGDGEYDCTYCARDREF